MGDTHFAIVAITNAADEELELLLVAGGSHLKTLFLKARLRYGYGVR